MSMMFDLTNDRKSMKSLIGQDSKKFITYRYDHAFFRFFLFNVYGCALR